MNKILFCASTASHIRNFHIPYIKSLSEEGYEVCVATNSDDPIPYAKHTVAFPIKKSLFSFSNIIAIFKFVEFLKKERFDKISTHTTLASVIIRLAILLLPKRERPRVYYVAHGFLFCETDGWKKWVYLLPEKICARVTNVLMVMNQEDLRLAEKHHLYKEQRYFIHGIGFDASRFKPFTPEERAQGRQALGFSPADFLFIYAAEFSKRKNQQFLIRAFAKVANQIPQAHLLLAGSGVLLKQCRKLVDKLHMGDRIHFLGYVKQMQNLYPLCDVAVSVSKIEGIPFNIMETMACGLPMLISNIKGHYDLVEDKREFLFCTEQELCEKLVKNVITPRGNINWSQTLKKYLLNTVMPQFLELYLS